MSTGKRVNYVTFVKEGSVNTPPKGVPDDGIEPPMTEAKRVTAAFPTGGYQARIKAT
jgi:hypothetical protein